MSGLRDLWDNFCEVPLVLSVVFWMLWFGMGILVGAALS